MIFSPSTLTETYGAGSAITLGVKATLTLPLSGDVYVAIVDPAGVTEGDVSIAPSSTEPGSYFATLRTSSTLPVARHQGALMVRLCRDVGCRAQHPGSPVPLPYDLQVIQGTNLTPLTRWPDVRDWETYQGNPAHTGYVPVTLDPSRFSPRWSWQPQESSINLLHPVIANGLVYVANSSEETRHKLFALRESDKETQWQVEFGAHALNPPAVSGGKVFVATTGHTNTFMWSFDAATGAQLSKTAFYSQWERYYAPTIEGGVAYTNCGHYGGMCAFNLADGTQKWFSSLSQFDQWTPAVDENYAYAYLDGVLKALDKSTGQVAVVLTSPHSAFYSPGVNGAPVLGANGSVIVVSGTNDFQSNHLLSFNPAMRRLNWSLPGSYGGNPVIAKGVVYATTLVSTPSRMQLEARSESSGELLWSWTPSGINDGPHYGMQGAYSDMLVTDNLIFVSTSNHVYAIDLATHAPVWTYWKGGDLALSANGVLYINSRGSLGAVNLK
jgi:hypothetical protein